MSCFLTLSDGCGLQGERERGWTEREKEKRRGDNAEKKGEREWPKEECGERGKMGSKEQLTAAVAVSAVALAASFRAVWSTLRCFANSCNKTSTILHTQFPSQWESLITASSSYSNKYWEMTGASFTFRLCHWDMLSCYVYVQVLSASRCWHELLSIWSYGCTAYQNSAEESCAQLHFNPLYLSSQVGVSPAQVLRISLSRSQLVLGHLW